MEPSTKLKICIYTARDFPYGAAAENFVRMMALGLYENGAKVEVVRFRGRLKANANDTSIPCRNFLFSFRPVTEWGKLLEWLVLPIYIPLFLIVRRLFKGREVLLLYGIEYAQWGYPFMLSSKLLGQKCFRIITDKYPASTLAPVFWKRPKLYLYKLQFRQLDSKLSGLIVLTEKMKQQCIQLGVAEQKVLIINHFVRIEEPQTTTIKKETDPLIIGFSGNTDLKNGTDILIKAFAQVLKIIPTAKLWIMGHHNSALEALADELQMTKEQVIFHGFISQNGLKNYLMECDILVNPRRTSQWAEYGFSTKLAEYLSLNKNIITGKSEEIECNFRNLRSVHILEEMNSSNLSEKILSIFLEQNNQNQDETFQWASRNLDYKKNGKRLINFLTKTK